ncbi:MAG TPA: LCP family protein [Solirubrobacteraceae bacterium]|jgi:LCP family protein required for cell wall assembly|nr:LCP family protein [Solirubrobacteraceae bacterium]
MPPPPPAGAPPGSLPPEPPRHGWWLARRFLAAGVCIFLLAGAATYMVIRNEVDKVVRALGQNKPVKVAPKVLIPTSTGEPETLLLVGNDERKAPKGNPSGAVLPHSNEMLLVRIDPSKPTISMLSIPRELRVTFTKPNGALETNRINSAYTYGYEEGGGTSGGVKLMLETIKNLLGITVNHVFVTDFKRFEHAVDEIGCVYMTVDKRYYHNNDEPGAEQYFEINLEPGYQRLCGKEALEFVANRHESTSLIRDARDQRFLLDGKAQYGPGLFGNREKFEKVLGKAVQTDLHGEEQVLDLLELLAESAGKPVRQVPFHVNLLPTYDTASPLQLQEAAHSFLAGTAPIPKHKLNSAVRSVKSSHRSTEAALSLTPTPSATVDRALVAAPRLPFPLEVPQYQKTTAEASPDELKLYGIQSPNGRHHYPSYVIVVDDGELGQYYDIQGSTWTGLPLLSDPSQSVRIGSRTYSLYYDGEHIKTVAWREGRGVYWIENTLTYSLSPETMVAIARTTRPVGSSNSTVPAVSAAPHRLAVALPTPSAATASSRSNLEAAIALLSLVIVALLGLRLLYRQRELKALRAQVAEAMALEAARATRLRARIGLGARPQRQPAAEQQPPAGGEKPPAIGGEPV